MVHQAAVTETFIVAGFHWQYLKLDLNRNQLEPNAVPFLATAYRCTRPHLGDRHDSGPDTWNQIRDFVVGSVGHNHRPLDSFACIQEKVVNEFEDSANWAPRR